jgi:hypothetical protein
VKGSKHRKGTKMFKYLTADEKYELIVLLVRGYQNTQDDNMATELFDLVLELA